MMDFAFLQHSGETALGPEDHGMHPAVYALAFGILSGTSLPLGSWLGIVFSPVHAEVCALMMAFGAGALLFAVTVELYGHALHQVAAGHLSLHEFFTTILGALIGGAFYLTINQWLEEYLMHDEEGDGTMSLPASQAMSGGKRASVVKFLDDVEFGDGEGSASLGTEVVGETTSLMDAVRKQERAAQIEKEDGEKSTTAGGLWKKGITRIISTQALTTGTQSQRLRGREKALRALHNLQEVQHAKSVAFALFLGLLVDGVPEGILMGFLAAEGNLTPVLIISLFVANFPEAFSSSSLLIQAKMSTAKIIGMWTGLCALVGCLAGLSCWLLLLCYPEYGHGKSHLPMSVLIGIALVEGITGGAMIACIASVMLPEAFERAGKSGPFFRQSGFLCLSGFLLSASLKALFG